MTGRQDSVRAALIDAERDRLAVILDGLPEDRHPREVRRRLYRLQAGEEVRDLPGHLVGRVFGIPVTERARTYVLTVADVLLPWHMADAHAARCAAVAA